MALWAMAARSSEPTIIMEDDARFDAQSLLAVLDALAPHLSPLHTNPVMISLACIGPFCSGSDSVSLNLASGLESKCSTRLVRSPILPLGTAAYVLTPAAARVLCTAMEKVEYHVDFNIAMLVKACSCIKQYVVLPPPVAPHNTVDTSSLGTGHTRSLLFWWSPGIMWTLNVPATRFTSAYSTVLAALLFLLGCAFVCRPTTVLGLSILFLALELTVFLAS
jgi:GR25 family glycosyltransferase involved in LPS biosynthesis